MPTKIQKEYESDFYAWTMHNAELIRQGKFSEIDSEHIAEEIESMGRSDQRELANRLAVLIGHLLKWQYQPTRRGKSWQLTIKVQRMGILRLIKQSPSLKHKIHTTLNDAYEEASVIAASETGLNESHFPANCPFTFEQCVDQAFFPE